MAEHISNLYNYIHQMFGSNEFFTAGVGLYFITLFTLLLNKCRGLLRYIVNSKILTLTLVHDSVDSNRQIYANFCKWYSSTTPKTRLKTFKLLHTKFLNITNFESKGNSAGVGIDSVRPTSSEPKQEFILSIGYGFHWFIWNRRLYWFTMSQKDSNGSLILEEINLKTFGSYKNFQEILDLIQPVEEVSDSLYVSLKIRGAHWERQKVLRTSLNSVVLNSGVLETIIKEVEHFIENKNWYLDNGLPYKLVICLEGEPGTGKTSLIRALSSYFSSQLFLLDLNSCSNSTLKDDLTYIAGESAYRGRPVFVAIEDIDDCPALLSRTDESEGNKSLIMDSNTEVLSLSGILNAFDGLIPIQNLICFISTNKFSKLDSAFVRKRRIDRVYNIGKLNNEAIHRFIKLKYSVEVDYYFQPMLGCDLSDLWQTNLESFDDFLNSLLKLNNYEKVETGLTEPQRFNPQSKTLVNIEGVSSSYGIESENSLKIMDTGTSIYAE